MKSSAATPGPAMSERTPTRGHYDLYQRQTPAQTLGPFFHQGLLRSRGDFPLGVAEGPSTSISHVLVDERTPGERLSLEGCVYDGRGEPVTDALIELWQADARGRYAHPLDLGEPATGPGFRGFGRAATNPAGAYSFVTIKPGNVPGPGGSVQAPHLNLIVGARGLSRHVFTRAYFEGDAELARDPVLSRVPSERRQTLMARRTGASAYRFEIRLQGEFETVFFEL